MIQYILIALFVLALAIFLIQVPFRLVQQIKLGNKAAAFAGVFILLAIFVLVIISL